jgi:hypothetical protein
MRRQPDLDIAATFRRQFIVDIGVQFVFGDGNPGLGHGRCLCPITIEMSWPAAGNLASRKRAESSHHRSLKSFITP